MIIDLFNFNRSISSIIINDLHTIEMRLSSAISYEIMNIKKYPCFNKEDKNTIFDCTNDEFNYLSTNLNHILEQRKNNDSKDWTEIPLYDLSLIWTFGISVQFFNKLKNTIQKTILEKYFSKLKGIELDTFKYLLFSFVNLRNKISHNEVIYNFKCENNNIFKICNKNDKRIKQKIKKKIEKDFSKLLSQQIGIKLNTFYLIRIIGLINNNKKLEEKILDKIKELKNSIYKGKRKENDALQKKYYPCKEAWENICNFLGFKDNINIDDD